MKELASHQSISTPTISETAGYGSSDHTSFTVKQMPVLFFFSGLHADYHKPSDTWDKINAPAAVKLLDLVSEVATHLADDPGRPQFVRVVEQQPHGQVAGSIGQNRSMAPISAAFRILRRFPMVSDLPTFAPDRPPTKPG